ncbi:MAG: acyl-coenzyme A thioesterase PaaI-like protein [Alteromonadaceae bacterium]|jgi:acyl-coenzyme A thioesterase PaaI-like protein
MENILSRYVTKINKLPKFMRSFLLTKLFCTKVKYAGTSGIELLSINNKSVKLRLKNRKKSQNHIGGIHAAAAALLAESTTGIVLGLNVPDTRIPLIKSMKVNYLRRMQGDLQAIATLTDKQIDEIVHQEKGTLMIPVEITDDSGEQPIVCEMEWAWIVKNKK